MKQRKGYFTFFCLFLVFGLAVSVGAQSEQEVSGPKIIDTDENTFGDTQPQEETSQVESSVPYNRILVGVDDQIITMADYKAEHGDTELTYGRLDPMIDRLLLLKAAKDRSIETPENRVNKLFNRQLSQIQTTPGGLSSFLERRGLTREQYERKLKRDIKKRFLESRVLVDEFPQVRNQDTQPAYVSVRARLLFLDDVTTAWHIYNRLQVLPTEKTWNHLYEKYSQKLGLMDKNGSLGWFNWGQYNRDIEYRVYKLPIYAVSEPFPLQDGYALVYPTGFRLDPTNPVPSRSVKALQSYRRQFLTEKLYEKLHEEYSVVIPESVQQRIVR